MTATAIVNAALRRIGIARLDDPLDSDQSRAGIAARDIYDECRRTQLALHSWKFAKKRIALTASATVPVFGWLYAYPLPEDFIRVVSVHPTTDESSHIEYRLETSASDDRVIITNSATCYLIYIFDQQDANVFSPQFRSLLAYACAMDLATALNRPDIVEQISDAGYRRLLGTAKAIDGMEDFPSTMAEGTWVTERERDPGW